MLSQYCEECLKFTEGVCKGKEGSIIITTCFGHVIGRLQSFLKFCKRYQFDVKLWPLDKREIERDDTFGKVETTIKQSAKQSAKIIKQSRRVAKQERITIAENIAVAAEVDTGEQLSSADFDDLLI